MNNKTEYIICSAIHYENGVKSTVLNVESGTIICGRRHGDCYAILSGILGNIDPDDLPSRDKQGFLTSHNRFVDRKEAYLIAKECGQLLHNLHDQSNPILVSEDLY